jgi:transcriptional regulator with XRE-family HTH domain
VACFLFFGLLVAFSNSEKGGDPVKISGQTLRLMRMSVGMRQDIVADLIGCTRQYVSLVELGKRRPSKELLERWISVFEFTADDFKEVV